MKADIFNTRIIDLWGKYYGNDEDALSPLLYKTLKENCLLFIGLNPSFSLKGFKSFLKEETVYNNLGSEKILSMHKFVNLKENKDHIIKMQYIAVHEYKKYFGKFIEISKYIKLPWEHIDLFYKRETSGQKIKKEYYPKKKLTNCAKEQFQITMEIIEGLKPKVIVVVNALASDIIKKQIDSLISFREDYGIHIITMGQDKYPIFFSGMLTGQHALDTGSYERLRWHINFARPLLH